jgi:hypothetical protein
MKMWLQEREFKGEVWRECNMKARSDDGVHIIELVTMTVALSFSRPSMRICSWYVRISY